MPGGDEGEPELDETMGPMWSETPAERFGAWISTRRLPFEPLLGACYGLFLADAALVARTIAEYAALVFPAIPTGHGGFDFASYDAEQTMAVITNAIAAAVGDPPRAVRCSAPLTTSAASGPWPLDEAGAGSGAAAVGFVISAMRGRRWAGDAEEEPIATGA
jgi:hypothetical protein